MFLLVPAYPGSPGQKAVKRLCVCVSVRVCVCTCVYVRATTTTTTTTVLWPTCVTHSKNWRILL